MTTLNLNNRNDDLIELNKNSFDKSPFSFNIPSKQNRVDTNAFKNDEILFNKNKISSDVVSMSSRSSSRASSVNGDSYDKKKYFKKMQFGRKNNDDTDSESSDASSVVSQNVKKNKIQMDERSESSVSNESGESVDSSEGDENDESSEGSVRSDSGSSNGSKIVKKSIDPRQRMLNELNEKREIIYQLDRLEAKGYKMPFKFNMNSDLEEMRHEYHRVIREKELDASVRFQQKMLMAFVSGTEYLNTRYDPFAIKLDGWSEQVNENINDYDDIFEELHVKYKSSGKKMAPELRLLISLSGSAFMFHLTSRMFKEQPLPDVENVLKSNPELMKQFQNAAAKQYIIGNNTQQPQFTQQRQPQQDNGMGLFNMVSNLFGSLNSTPIPSQQHHTQNVQRPTEDVDSIIQNVHNKISIDNMDNNIETLSVSDEEITSIIEDTADIKILRNTKGRNNGRTLNI